MVAVWVNRDVKLDLSQLDFGGLNIGELWFFGDKPSGEITLHGGTIRCLISGICVAGLIRGGLPEISTLTFRAKAAMNSEIDLGVEALMDAVQSCCSPIWVNLSRSAPASTVDDNGTCGFFDTGDRKFLVTASHVVEKFRQLKAATPSAVLAVNLGPGATIELENPILVDEDADHLDLAIIEFPHLNAIAGNTKRYFPIRTWPISPVAKGEAVTLVGFPGVLRQTTLRWGSFSPAGLGFVVSSVSDRNIVLADEHGTRRTRGGGFREDEHIPLGGFSGCPGFVLRKDRGHVVGFLRGGSKEIQGKPPVTLPGVVFLSPATFLKPDGTFDRLRMPW